MPEQIYPAILSGGSGSRLWPVSRAGYPKQFQKLTADLSMIQETALCVSGEGFAPAVVVTNETERFLVAQAFSDIDLSLDRILLEPAARNTAPAMAAAALYLMERDADAIMLALPSDHAMNDAAAFRAAVADAVPAARAGRIVTFGIRPTEAHTGYGYIEAGPVDGAAHRPVVRFAEKPDAETAARFLAAGTYFWNSGMFMTTAATLLDELQRHRAHRVVVLPAHRREGAPAFLDVAPDAAEHADVRVGIDEDLDVEHPPQRLVCEYEDALDHHHRRGLHRPRLLEATMGGKVVDRNPDRLPRAKQLQVADQQRRLEGVGVVVVELGARFRVQLGPVVVVGVVLQEGGVLGEGLRQASRDRGLARPGRPGDPDDQRRHAEVIH